MDNFFSFFARHRLLANLLTITILVLGAGTLTSIKKDTFPEVKFGRVLVSTTYPGASPEDVELKVTNEIEKELLEVVGIQYYQSWSMENVSMINIRVDPDETYNEVIRDIRDAVNRVTNLPSEVKESPLVTELSTDEFPVLEVGISGELPYSELRQISRNIEKKLEEIDGVARLERYGYRAREIQIEVSPEKMKKHEVSLAEIVGAIQQRNIQSTGGSFESYTSEKNIVTMAEFRDPMEVGDAIVKATFSGPIVKIKDLAFVRDDYEDQKVLSRVNGESAISFVVFKKSSADIIRTVDAIKSMVDKDQQYLPRGVRISISNDQSTYIKNRFEIVVINGAMGLALLLLVLSIALNKHIAFWVALGIPVSIMGTIFLLPLLGFYLDSVALTAMILVMGIVVDDAIIIAEQIYQKAEQGLAPVQAAAAGVKEVFKPVLTTVLTTIIAFSPLFFMSGMLSSFVFVIPLVVCIALGISLLESTLALPAHLTHGLRSNTLDRHKKRSLFNLLKRGFSWALSYIIKVRYLIIVAFVAALVYALHYASTQMKFVMFPSSTADKFTIFIETPIGTSLKATSDRVAAIESIIAELNRRELDSFVSRIGTFGDMGASERENNAAITVGLTPFSQRTRSADEILESLRPHIETVQGIETVRYEIDAGGPPVGKPIHLRVVGGSEDTRKRLAADIVSYLNSLPGTKDIDRDDKQGKDQVEIKLDYEKLARLGISVAEVAQNVRIAYDGEVATSVRYGDDDVDFRVLFSSNVRKSPEGLGKLWLRNKANNLTALYQVASFKPTQGRSNIYHFEGDRAITVTGSIDPNTTNSLEVTNAVLEHFDLYKDYPGIRLSVGGEAKESQESLIQLFIIMGLAAFGVYCLLMLLFNSVWQPLLVMIALPFGVIGVVVGFAIQGDAFGFLAMTGIIGLAGVVVNDSLVLVNHINRLTQHELGTDVKGAVVDGTCDRLRPILLTTASTVAGLLPLAYGLGGADPYMSPMALALGWGILFATPLTLVLLPCLYMCGNDIKKILAYFE